MCFSESSLCHGGTVDVRACLLRSLLGVSLDVVCIPSTQRSEAQLLCACLCPNHSNSSTGLQHQQQTPAQQQRSSASVVPSPGTAAGKPCSCCCGGQDVSHSSSNTVYATLSGNIMQFLLIILTTKRSLHLLTCWSKEQHRVCVFNAMLVVIFIPQLSVHFRIGGYDLLRCSKRT